ncbi:hypothetical protein BCR42DRAFT_425383 [Absidia repens]|uniref:Uncharacterized protein n=1 Tax=Absidia repens TaxID=90262 RepID=A0A1X2I2U8_9FUNG|nr:hypothetical protein BCR42DRAFT_425383 [Absidia repens]
MQSISGIITQTHNTSGEIPPPLVGSSISVVDDLVLVFAGRLVTSRQMTNHLYVLNLTTHVWTRHIAPPDSDKAPKPRYFHTTNVHGRSLVVFGGMGYSRQSADGLCVLDDVAVFNVDTMSWKQPLVQPSLFVPRPRYAHLATISDHHLFVIGGQDMDNGYLPEINVLDLDTFEWVQAIALEQHVGAYRSVAVATPIGTSLPASMKKNQADGRQDDPKNDDGTEPDSNMSTATRNRMSILYTDLDYNPPADTPGPIFMYSNYNFADVNRELQLMIRQPSSSTTGDGAGSSNGASLEDVSEMMTGTVMPPGLRFPTGDILGQHAIIAGTYLSPQSQSYSLWGLNTATLAWTRVDTGTVFSTGSWNRGVLHSKCNRYLVFGNMHRNLLEDYNHRQVNFEHMASVDLEVFGIYRQPKMTCSPLAQEMGLRLLNEPTVADFYVITRESQEIPVNSAVLRHRWPYFAKLLKDADLTDDASSAHKRQQKQGSMETGLCDIQEDSTELNKNDATKSIRTDINYSTTARCMTFPYAYPVVVALLQYLYTDNLLTAQQYQPHILSQLLLLADMYNMPRLISLATHALHQMLNMSTAPLILKLPHCLIKQHQLQQNSRPQQQQQQPQQQHRLSQYNSNGANDGKDWDAVSMTSTTFQQQFVDQYQSSPTPTASLSSSYYPSSSLSSELDLKQPQHMSPTLGAYRGRIPSIGNRSMFSVSGSSTPSTPNTYHASSVSSRQTNTIPGSRSYTSVNHYGSSRHTTSSAVSSKSTANAMSPSSSSSYYSEPTQHSFPFNSNNISAPAPASTIPEDDTLSVSSFSAYGNQTTVSSSSSSSKDTTHQRKRRENKFLNALGNKFSISRS